MAKTLFLTFLTLFYLNFSFAQFSFKDDSTDMRIQSWATTEIDKKFGLEKDNDFELRLFTFPRSSDKLSSPFLFILSNKNGKWNTRLFKDLVDYVGRPNRIEEVPLKKDSLETLWKQLNEHEVLSIPKAYTLLNKNGEMIIEERQDDITYSFELLAKKAVRHYSYHCPLFFSKKYDYIPTFSNVSKIIQIIFEYCNIETKTICRSGEHTTLGFMQGGLDQQTSDNCKSQLKFWLDE